MIACTEVPLSPLKDQLVRSNDSNLVEYQQLDFVPGVYQTAEVPTVYAISIPYPAESQNVKLRTADQAAGTMLVRMNIHPANYNTTLITASDNCTGYDYGTNRCTDPGYASLLYYLMYGQQPNASMIPPDSPFFFAAKCEMTSIKYRDNYKSRWRQVDFILQNGVSRVNVTDTSCPNPKGE